MWGGCRVIRLHNGLLWHHMFSGMGSVPDGIVEQYMYYDVGDLCELLGKKVGSCSTLTSTSLHRQGAS